MFNLWQSKHLFLKVFLLFVFFTLVSCSDRGNEKNSISVSVVFQGAGKGVIRSAPAGIECGVNCKATFDYKSGEISLTAEPAADSVFVSWQGHCHGAGTCKLDSKKNHSVIAVFDIKPTPMINIAITHSGNGKGAVLSTPVGIDCGSRCQAKFKQNSGSITLTANADTDSVFSGWQGDCQGENPQCLLDSNIDHTVRAVFDVKPTLYIDNLSLINADTDLVITQYDPLLASTILDLATLPTRNLNLRVNTTQQVESVRITIDNTNISIDNEIPYSLNDVNGNYEKWAITPGKHAIVMTPYSLDNAQGDAGESKTLVFTLNEAKWTFSNSLLEFISNLGEPAASAQTIILSNTGNVVLNYSVTGVPAWLTVSPATGVVLEAASSNLQFQTEQCTVEGLDNAVVTVTAGALTQTITITHNCTPSAN